MAERVDLYQFIFDDIKKRLDDPRIIYSLHDRRPEFTPVPSDITVIDEVLEGGLPEGKIVEIFGSEASGKTTLTLHFIAAAQRRGFIVYFIDAEQSLDMDYAQRIGVDPKKLLFSQPDYGEQAMDTARAICESTERASVEYGKEIRSLIVIDSIPALVPKAYFETYEKEGLDSSVALGGPARMMAQMLPPLVNKAGKAGVTVVFINQERDKIGISYGSPTTTPGGRSVKFFASLRLKVSRIGYYDRGGERAGIRTQLLPIKSKMFPIFGRKAEFVIDSNGINPFVDMAETLIRRGVFKKSGSWLKSDDHGSYQGIAKLEDALRDDTALREKMQGILAGTGGQSKPVELKPKQEERTVSKPLAPVVAADKAPPAAGVKKIGS